MQDTRLSELLRSGAVIPSLRGTSVEAVASELVDGLVEAEAIPHAHREPALIALLKRESFASTGLGAGVAIPHARVPFVRDFVAAIGLSRDGVDFHAADGGPVKAVFLLFSPAEDPYGHLWLLGSIAGMIKRPRFIEALLRTSARDQILDRITEAEDRLNDA
jgi:PTS system nitrogen regulatory IIA component